MLGIPNGRQLVHLRAIITSAAWFLGGSGDAAAAQTGKEVQADFDTSRPVGFQAQVMPTLSKLGCDSGGCHGKAGGRNGFALSLFGFDPKADFEALKRRVDPSDPDSSLLLLKPTAQLPHGGGAKLSLDSAEYQTLVRWIKGLDRDKPPPAEPKLTRLDVDPGRLSLPRLARSRVRVEASWDDGSVVDVTRLSRFETNSPPLVDVTPRGELIAGSNVGEAAILVRFGTEVAVSRVVVATGATLPSTRPEANSTIDRLVGRKLDELGLTPSETCTDAEFARRSSIDIVGLLPDPSAVIELERDLRPDKRSRWVDALLDRPEYADVFATKWTAILRNRRALGELSKPSTFGFHAWVRQAIAENWSYDRFVEAIVAGRGDAGSNPSLGWYRQVSSLEERTGDVAQVFLGTRIGCARCHHHPSERLGQEDYAGFASFFARVGTKSGADATTFRVFNTPTGLATNAKTGEACLPRPLGATGGLSFGPRDDPRAALAAWMVEPGNPLFARAVVNRYWKHFLGQGLVEPEDDFRAANPPTNPELLDAMALDFVERGFDLKRLIRSIANSDAYARSSLPNSTNSADRGGFARYPPKRLPAEVLLDAINLITGVPGSFDGVPEGSRASQLPDDGFASPFLDAFGRPGRRTACECERTADPSLSQALFLLNSTELEAKLSAPDGRAARYAGTKDSRPDAAKVEELYRAALARPPSPDESARALGFLDRERRRGQAASGFADLIWAIINTKEFLFNH